MIRSTPEKEARLKEAKRNDAARRQKELARERKAEAKARDSLKAAKAREKQRRSR